jgi:hypothetical protein
MIPLPLILFSIFLIIAFSIVAWKGFTKYRVLIAFLIASGASMIFGGLSHIFVPNIVSQNIGWVSCPEFQYEVGIANILIGILLVLSYNFDNDWILAALVASTIWGWGNALGHIISYKKTKNKSPGNMGWALYIGIFPPIISIILYMIYKYDKNIF